MNWFISLLLLGLSYGFHLEIEGVKNITYLLVWTLGLFFMSVSIWDYDKKHRVLTIYETAKLWIYKSCVMCLALVVGYQGDYFTAAILLMESICIKRPLP